MSEHKARILYALGLKRLAVVLATNSEWVQFEVDAISSSCEDIGILDRNDYEADPGIYLWEGVLEVVWTNSEGGYEPETEYVGTSRPVEGGELARLLEMSPPIHELVQEEKP